MKIGNTSTSPRRRKKINYNSFYNANLKNNNYLKKHPENRMQPFVTRDHAYSYATDSASMSRGSLSPAITPFFGPGQNEIQKYYVVEETTTIQLNPQSFEEIINEAEDGEILAIEAITSSPEVTVEIVIYGLGNSPNVINDYSIDEMINRGRGLTPGEVEELPGGRSKDPSGIPRRYYPYIARYKADLLEDHLGMSRATFVFAYEPSIPMPYSSLIVNVKNTSMTSGIVVDSVNIHRRIYDNPYADNLVGTPIESSMLFAPANPGEQQPTTPPPPPGVSPFIASYQQRLQAAQQKANEPELLPEDIY